MNVSGELERMCDMYRTDPVRTKGGRMKRKYEEMRLSFHVVTVAVDPVNRIFIVTSPVPVIIQGAGRDPRDRVIDVPHALFRIYIQVSSNARV